MGLFALFLSFEILDTNMMGVGKRFGRGERLKWVRRGCLVVERRVTVCGGKLCQFLVVASVVNNSLLFYVSVGWVEAYPYQVCSVVTQE